MNTREEIIRLQQSIQAEMQKHMQNVGLDLWGRPGNAKPHSPSADKVKEQEIAPAMDASPVLATAEDKQQAPVPEEKKEDLPEETIEDLKAELQGNLIISICLSL